MLLRVSVGPINELFYETAVQWTELSDFRSHNKSHLESVIPKFYFFVSKCLWIEILSNILLIALGRL